jgi:predicted MFS family arabinose efflux permease
MGAIQAAIGFGVCLGPPVGGVLFHFSPWQPWAVGTGFLLFVTMLAIAYAWMFSDVKQEAGQDDGSEDACRVTSNLMTDTGIVCTLLMIFIACLVMSGMESTVGIYQEKHLKWSTSQVGLAFSVCTICYVLGTVLAALPQLNTRRWRVTAVGMFVLVAGMVLSPKDSNVVELGMLCLVGIGTGLVVPTGSMLLKTASFNRHGGTGFVFVLMANAQQAAFVSGPVIGTTLLATTSFQVMCYVLGFLCLCCLLLILMCDSEKLSTDPVPDTQPPHSPELPDETP